MKKITTENHVKALVKDWFDGSHAWSYAPIQNGLGVHGLADRIGVIPVVVTPAMVGKTIGLFVSVESKKPGRRTEPNRGMSKHQVLVMEATEAAGGIAICCDGEEDLLALTNRLYELTDVPTTGG